MWLMTLGRSRRVKRIFRMWHLRGFWPSLHSSRLTLLTTHIYLDSPLWSVRGMKLEYKTLFISIMACSSVTVPTVCWQMKSRRLGPEISSESTEPLQRSCRKHPVSSDQWLKWQRWNKMDSKLPCSRFSLMRSSFISSNRLDNLEIILLLTSHHGKIRTSKNI
jgi:hypothetical protein